MKITFLLESTNRKALWEARHLIETEGIAAYYQSYYPRLVDATETDNLPEFLTIEQEVATFEVEA